MAMDSDGSAQFSKAGRVEAVHAAERIEMRG